MVLDHKFANTGVVSIQDLLQSDSIFTVPRFQRNYVWKKDKAEALWLDITENFMLFKDNAEHTRDAEYLLGPVVLVRGDKPHEFLVIDGQQRLSTLTMLFCVARDIILEYIQPDDHTKPTGLEKINEMIENTSLGDHKSWKLVLNDTDKDLFVKIQTNTGVEAQAERLKIPAKTSSEKLLLGNYKFLHKAMSRALAVGFDFNDNAYEVEATNSVDIEKIRDNIKMLNYFLAYVKEYNFVVKIMVDEDSTAYQIFETLNERGQTLSKSNLIKNRILKSVDQDDALQRDLSDRWNRVLNAVMSQKQRDDAFILESLRSRHFETKHKMSPKNLYKITKDLVTDAESCKRYIENLETDAKFLTMLNDTSSYSDPESLREIEAIKALDAKSIRVPALVAHRRWGFNEDYRKIVRFLVKFFFKFRTVGGAHPGKVDNIITEVTKSIETGDPLDEIIYRVKTKDNHSDFLTSFAKHEWRGNHAKYALQQISMHLGSEDTVPSINNLALEHILPEDHSQWPLQDFFTNGADAGDLDEHKHNIGNLTILEKAMDPTKQSMLFLDKKKAYDESELSINKDTVCNHDKWVVKTIESRNKKLTDCATSVWNLGSF